MRRYSCGCYGEWDWYKLRINVKVQVWLVLGNGFGTVCGRMRWYSCGWYGELNCYNAWSNEKLQV